MSKTFPDFNNEKSQNYIFDENIISVNSINKKFFRIFFFCIFSLCFEI